MSYLTYGLVQTPDGGEVRALVYVEDDASPAPREPDVLVCEWFALCENPAESLEPHPALGNVPICGRCKAKLEALA